MNRLLGDTLPKVDGQQLRIGVARLDKDRPASPEHRRRHKRLPANLLARSEAEGADVEMILAEKVLRVGQCFIEQARVKPRRPVHIFGRARTPELVDLRVSFCFSSNIRCSA